MNTLEIEAGRKYIEDKEFANTSYEEIIIPDSVKEIGYEAFRNCKNLKKVKLPKNLKLLGDAAFFDCVSLESIDIPESLQYFPRLCFANCTNLKTINAHDNINYFDHHALYNCSSLEDFKIPNNITYIGTQAMFNCKKIERIRIPASMEEIECAAFACMDNLKEIIVDAKNERYKSFDCISLIDVKNGVFLQFAPNTLIEKYEVTNYPCHYDDFPSKEDIYHIADYAFANAKHLKTLNVTSALESFGANTFKGTKLKTLNVAFHTASKNVILYGYQNNPEVYFPFTEINFQEGIESLSDNMSELFRKVRSLTLPSTLEQIGTHVFNKAKFLKEISIPSNCNIIYEQTFPDNIILHFDDIGDVNSSDFISLHSKYRNGDIYSNERYTKIYLFKDGNYKVVFNDFEPITINKNDIARFSKNSQVLEDEPDIFIEYFLKMQFIHSRLQDVYYRCIKDDEIYNVFRNFFADFDNIETIANEKIKELISTLIENENRFKQVLLNGYLMKHVSKKNILLILNNYTPELERFLNHTTYLEKLNKDKMYEEKYYNFEYIVNYTNLLHEYNIKDEIYYNIYLAFDVTPENQKLIIKNYSKNLKRLLIASGCLNNSASINDLINLINVLGGFSEDKIISQKVLTFITEKIFDKTKKKKMTSDKIHNIFNELNVKDEVNYEFVEFFIKNFVQLLEIEKEKAGFIANIYNYFEDISASSLANNGSSRKLKVTIEKCLFYLIRSFNNITDENKQLAALLCKYYFEDEILTKAEELIEEASKANRNIFTDSNNEEDDLKCKFDNNYSYEWLIKQSYDNLVLGKYCHCCAHIKGNGAGIMRASMINNDVQNLVIKDPDGLIILKSTLYVNRQQGYGIFNTIEANDDLYNDDEKKKIYEIFMKGVLDFIEVYNKNNKVPIRTIHIGTKQNKLLDVLSEYHHVEKNLPNIYYPKYAYTINDKTYGEYEGDANISQLCLYKK